MSRNFGVPIGSESDELATVLRSAQKLDPGCSEEAVRRYVHEIAEMAVLLDALELGNDGITLSSLRSSTTSDAP